ncbi:MAG: leucine-rich repeat protein [Clostridia bacterium]|nr:leucine-rich repeat protein [Clostridia bacterium]
MATLNSVTIPEGVTVIDSSAFEGCGNLQTLKLPKTLTTVADNAFLNCPSNMKVTSQVPVSELKI